jgi:hypothetical protein
MEKPGIEFCIAQPGVITDSRTIGGFLRSLLRRTDKKLSPDMMHEIDRAQLAAVLYQVTNGFEWSELSHEYLIRIGVREIPRGYLQLRREFETGALMRNC